MAALAIALLTLLGVAGEGLGQGGDTIATGLPGGVAALEGCLETAAETFRLADAALACGQKVRVVPAALVRARSARLMTVPGVGASTAVRFLAAAGPRRPSRFQAWAAEVEKRRGRRIATAGPGKSMADDSPRAYGPAARIHPIVSNQVFAGETRGLSSSGSLPSTSATDEQASVCEGAGSPRRCA